MSGIGGHSAPGVRVPNRWGPCRSAARFLCDVPPYGRPTWTVPPSSALLIQRHRGWDESWAGTSSAVDHDLARVRYATPGLAGGHNADSLIGCG